MVIIGLILAAAFGSLVTLAMWLSADFLPPPPRKKHRRRYHRLTP